LAASWLLCKGISSNRSGYKINKPLHALTFIIIFPVIPEVTAIQILKELKNNFTGKIGIGHCDFQILPGSFEHLDWHEH
jgi:hypothetical protein